MTTTISDVCFILDDNILKEKYVKEIKEIKNQTDVNISLVAINDLGSCENNINTYNKKNNSSKNVENESNKSYNIGFSQVISFLRRLFFEGPYTLIIAERHLAWKLDRTYMEKLSKLQNCDSERRHVSDVEELSGVEKIRFSTKTESGTIHEIPEDVVDEITSSCDLVILLGFNKILRGSILTKPDFGVLSLHPSDIRKYRGRPGGFHQYINNENEIGMTVQQLTTTLDGGHLVHCEHVDISDAKSYDEVRLKVKLLTGTGLFAKSIQKLNDPQFSPEELNQNELGGLTYHQSRNKWKNTIRVVLKNLYNRYLT